METNLKVAKRLDANSYGGSHRVGIERDEEGGGQGTQKTKEEASEPSLICRAQLGDISTTNLDRRQPLTNKSTEIGQAALLRAPSVP